MTTEERDVAMLADRVHSVLRAAPLGIDAPTVARRLGVSEVRAYTGLLYLYHRGRADFHASQSLPRPWSAA